jgi:hypothetical protein
MSEVVVLTIPAPEVTPERDYDAEYEAALEDRYAHYGY